MTLTLRPRQHQAVADLRNAYAFGHRAPILEIPTMQIAATNPAIVFQPGLRIGRLLLVSKESTPKGPIWQCVCDCGNKSTVTQSNLKRSTRSCGCLARELSSARMKATAKPKQACCIDGCEKPIESRSMCAMHAQRVRRYGDPNRVTSDEERKRRCREAALIRCGDQAKPTTYRKLHNRHAHRVIAEQIIGRPLRPGEIVHHIDGDKHNNSPSNLQVMTQSEHIALHRAEMEEAKNRARKASDA